MAKEIAIKDLQKGYSAFGNKGAVWGNEIHIAPAGLGGVTLCGVPMLSTNWARPELQAELGYDRQHIGCKECIAEYEKQTTTN